MPGTQQHTSTFSSAAFYFLYYGAAATLIPFLPLYYAHVQLTGQQIGLLTGVTPLIGLIATPLWGALADLTRRHKLILLVSVGGMAGLLFSVSRFTAFGWIMALVALYAFVAAPIIPLIDNAVLHLLGEHKDRYGRVRLWGAIGWGVTSSIAGVLSERFGLQLNFYLFFFLLLIGLAAAWAIPMHRLTIKTEFWVGIRRILLAPQYALFWVAIFIGGFGGSVITNYLFLHMEWMGASNSLMGISLAVATVSETIVLFFSEKMLRRSPAHTLIVFALLAAVARSLAYSFIRAPWLVLPVQLLHGLTFSLLWVAGISFLRQITPPDLGATVQGLFTSVMFGLGGIAGGLVGGYFYDTFGTAALFRWAGVAVLAGVILFAFGQRRLLARQKAASSEAQAGGLSSPDSNRIKIE